MKIQQALAGVQRLLLDSAPVIYHVQGTAQYQPLMDYVFVQGAAGATELITSTITLAECLVKPYELGDAKLIGDFRDVIASGAETQLIGIDHVAESAAEFRARYRLQLTDAFQVAAALSAGCQALLTNDAGLKRVRELTVLVLDDLEL